jgi:hypothetical protein
MTIDSPRTTVEVAGREAPTEMEAAVHMAYMAQQRIDGYEVIVKHAISQKNAFDRCMRKSSGEVVFCVGQLVQVYHSDLDYTFKMEQKLVPKWSQPYCIRTHIQNTYTLERLNGTEVEGEFSVRRLREFTPKPNGKLEVEQEGWLRANPDSEEAEVVRTPLFVRGEHGVGDMEQAG